MQKKKKITLHIPIKPFSNYVLTRDQQKVQPLVPSEPDDKCHGLQKDSNSNGEEFKDIIVIINMVAKLKTLACTKQTLCNNSLCIPIPCLSYF